MSDKKVIQSGDVETARSTMIALIDMIYDAGMVIEIRNPGRLAGDFIEINRTTIMEANIDVD